MTNRTFLCAVADLKFYKFLHVILFVGLCSWLCWYRSRISNSVKRLLLGESSSSLAHLLLFISLFTQLLNSKKGLFFLLSYFLVHCYRSHYYNPWTTRSFPFTSLLSLLPCLQPQNALFPLTLTLMTHKLQSFSC
jgi:hypothetical protein